jgi:hypothetical protein
MRYLLIILLLLLFSQFSQGQLFYRESGPETDYDFWDKDMFFTIQTGIWQPLEKLDRNFDMTPNLGFRWGLQIDTKLILQMGASMNFPATSEPFDYTVNGSTYRAKSNNDVNGLLGAWLIQQNNIGQNFIFENYYGLGLTFINTNVAKEKNKNDGWYDVECFNLSIGFDLSRKMFYNDAIGIFLEYNFAPYFLFGRVRREFGSRYLITGLSYKL